MKKAIIISTMALCIGLVSNAEPSIKTNLNSDFTSVREFKVNPFCVSIAKGDFETVKKLVSLGAEINQKSEGMTPLMYAAKYNRTDILQFLIDHGADLKQKSDKGMTALKYAELHKAIDAQAILEEALKRK